MLLFAPQKRVRYIFYHICRCFVNTTSFCLQSDPTLINASPKKVLHCQTPQYLFEENALKILGAPRPIAKDYFIKEAERLKQYSLSDFELSDLKYIKENT